MRTSRTAPPRPTDEIGEVPARRRTALVVRASPALVAFGAAGALVVLAVVGP